MDVYEKVNFMEKEVRIYFREALHCDVFKCLIWDAHMSEIFAALKKGEKVRAEQALLGLLSTSYSPKNKVRDIVDAIAPISLLDRWYTN